MSSNSSHQNNQTNIEPIEYEQTKRSARRIAREVAMQSMYQSLINQASIASIQQLNLNQYLSPADLKHIDLAYLQRLIEGISEHTATLQQLIEPYLDRKIVELSPIEHSILLLGSYELLHCLDIPYKVVINESITIAKAFGSNDGYRYINGVLDKLVSVVRPNNMV